MWLSTYLNRFIYLWKREFRKLPSMDFYARKKGVI